MSNYNDYYHKRNKRIIDHAISDLKLDLSGLTIVTEAASGLFSLTSLIALVAGAEKVICLVKETKYGTTEEISKDIYNQCEAFGLENKPIITQNRSDEQLVGGHIVTNLGMVRPLDESLLGWIGDQAVIPYMCEAWELRPGDVDFDYCKLKNIPVMGTDENNHQIDVFSQCGMLAIKMLLEAGLEVVGNRIAILSSDHFGPVIHQALANLSCESVLYQIEDDYKDVENGDWDAVIVAEYNIPGIILGHTGVIKQDRLKKLLIQSPAVIQFAGSNNIETLSHAGCKVYPDVSLESYRMSKTLADLGPRPLIYLHAAGLKVGEVMAKAKGSGLTGDDLSRYVIKNAPAQVIN